MCACLCGARILWCSQSEAHACLLAFFLLLYFIHRVQKKKKKKKKKKKGYFFQCRNTELTRQRISCFHSNPFGPFSLYLVVVALCVLFVSVVYILCTSLPLRLSHPILCFSLLSRPPSILFFPSSLSSFSLSTKIERSSSSPSGRWRPPRPSSPLSGGREGGCGASRHAHPEELGRKKKEEVCVRVKK